MLPAVVLIWTSVLGYAAPSLASIGNASLDAYRQVVGNAVFWRAVVNTLVVAFSTALVTSTVGVLLGWIITRSNWRGRWGIDLLSFMSTGIPSIIVALAVMVFWLSVPIGIYGTVLILILASSYRIAATTRIARAGLLQIHAELEEASAASGAGPIMYSAARQGGM